MLPSFPLRTTSSATLPLLAGPSAYNGGRTLTLEVKDFRLCRKAAALTFARPCYASFHRPMPHNSFFSEKILSSRLLKLNAHLEKAALERLTFL